MYGNTCEEDREIKCDEAVCVCVVRLGVFSLLERHYMRSSSECMKIGKMRFPLCSVCSFMGRIFKHINCHLVCWMKLESI